MPSDLTPPPRRPRLDEDAAAPAPGAGLSGLSLRVFEMFVAVAQSGSMTAAAERLGVSQPAVSQAVRTLEEAVGRRLLDRSLRPAALTLAGSTVLHHASAMIGHLHALRSAAAEADSAHLPTLRIGMANSFAVTVGPPLIERLRHIASRWLVTSGPSETRIEGLVERRVDFVVSFDEAVLPPGFHSLKLFTEPYFLALPAAWDGPVDSLVSLAERLDMLRYGRHLHVSRQIEAWLERERVAAPLRYRFDTIDAVIAMVAAGLGWAPVTPLAFLRSAALAPRIRCLPLPGAPLTRTLALTARQDEARGIAPLIQRVTIELMQESFLPEIRRLLPGIGEHIRLGSPPGEPGRSRHVRQF